MTTSPRILKKPNEVMPYLDTIKSVTDANRNALGLTLWAFTKTPLKKGGSGLRQTLKGIIWAM